MSAIQSQPQKQKTAHRYVPMGGFLDDSWSIRHSPVLLFDLFVLNCRIFLVGLLLLLGSVVALGAVGAEMGVVLMMARPVQSLGVPAPTTSVLACSWCTVLLSA